MKREIVIKYLEQYRDLRNKINDDMIILNKLEEQIKNYVRDNKDSLVIDGAKAVLLNSSGIRSKWDNDGLKEYASEHPEILKYYSEKKSKQAVSIKVGNTPEKLNSLLGIEEDEFDYVLGLGINQ